MSFVEAPGGKSQRRFGGVARYLVIKLGQSAMKGPVMDWTDLAEKPKHNQHLTWTR
jgi:hypothetical protein